MNILWGMMIVYNYIENDWILFGKRNKKYSNNNNIFFIYLCTYFVQNRGAILRYINDIVDVKLLGWTMIDHCSKIQRI